MNGISLAAVDPERLFKLLKRHSKSRRKSRPRRTKVNPGLIDFCASHVEFPEADLDGAQRQWKKQRLDRAAFVHRPIPLAARVVNGRRRMAFLPDRTNLGTGHSSSVTQRSEPATRRSSFPRRR